MFRFSHAFFAIALVALVSAGGAQSEDTTLKKPTAEQVMLYATIINQHPATDRTKALDALDKWMAGSLQMSKMPKANDEKGTGERAACIAACCGFFGCNPVCVAGCATL